MPRMLRLGAWILVAAAAFGQQATAPAAPKKGSDQTAAQAPDKKAATAPAAPASRVLNPESPAAKLMLATPEQRENALAVFPADRQADIRKQLAWFDSLPKAQQDIQIRRLEHYAALPPDKKIIVAAQVQAFNKLPQERKVAIRRVLANFENLSGTQRAVRLNSPNFKSRFSPEELRIIENLADAWLPPM